VEMVSLVKMIEEYLLKALNEVLCPHCDWYISSDGRWVRHHLPYISVGDDYVEAGYRCPKGGTVVLYKFKLSRLNSFTNIYR